MIKHRLSKNLNPIARDRLFQVLNYSPESGVFTWKIAPNTRVMPGDVAGTFGATNRGRIQIDGEQYASHRLAWFYVHGVWPEGDIDHKDCDPTNNRIANLRVATRVENCRNQRARPNRTGFKGVSWVENRQVFVAAIRRQDRRKIYLGSFPTAEEAHKAYCAAADKYHGEFARYE